MKENIEGSCVADKAREHHDLYLPFCSLHQRTNGDMDTLKEGEIIQNSPLTMIIIARHPYGQKMHRKKKVEDKDSTTFLDLSFLGSHLLYK